MTLLPPFPLCIPKVDYRTEDGTANAGSDYEFAEGTLLFKPGETLKGISNTVTNVINELFSRHATSAKSDFKVYD